MILKPRPFRKLRKKHWSTTGLVGFWLFNEGSGGQVNDLSGNGYEGTITDGVWQGGKFGSTILFNDASTVINFGDVLDIGTSDFSYGIWFQANWSAANETHSLIAKSIANPAVGRYFIIIENGNIFTLLQTSGGNKTISTSETPYLDGKWHHAFVAIRRSGNMAFYIDSISIGTVDVSDGSANDYNTAYPLGLGAYQNGTDGLTFDRLWFDGLLDVPSIYNRALSASEIAQLYLKPFCMFERDPIELWSAATIGGEPPVGAAGIMTPWGGYWGPTY